MITKTLICPERVRKIPPQFSWVDHRLVRHRYIERVGAEAAALYLMLVTVADAQGLSYYSDAALGRALSMHPDRLMHARGDLIHAGLIAYKRPLYQVLSLDQPACEARDLSAAEQLAVFAQLRAKAGAAP